ncbi:hypothetical protein ABZ235_36570 [Streptomyces canus]|uniref:hypothetical protein n=1 Tax=Streptomyces canus TaxID=58343 RepID=UPI0033B062CD
MHVAGESGQEEFGAGHGVVVPAVAAGLVHHDGPLVGVLARFDEPVEALAVVGGGPGDDPAARVREFVGLLLELPESFECFGLLVLPIDEVVVVVGAPRLKEVKVVVPVAAAVGTDEFFVGGGEVTPSCSWTAPQSVPRGSE